MKIFNVRLIILIVVISSLFCLMFIPSFADEERSGYNASGFTPCIPDGGDFYYDGVIYVLPKSQTIGISYVARSISSTNGVVTFKYIDRDGEPNIVFYNSSTHYLVLNFDHLVVKNNFTPLPSDSVFYLMYKSPISRGMFLKPTFCDGFGRDYTISQPYYAFESSSDGLSYFFEANEGIFSYQNTTFVSYYYSGVGDPIYVNTESLTTPFEVPYIEFQASFNLANSVNNQGHSLLYDFYCHFTPEEVKPKSDINEIPSSIPSIVVEFIEGFFVALSNLEIYPGVSVMGILFAAFGILIFRYVIKLFAGG